MDAPGNGGRGGGTGGVDTSPMTAFLSGAIAIFVSGALMLGTRDVKDPRQAEVVDPETSTASRVR